MRRVTRRLRVLENLRHVPILVRFRWSEPAFSFWDRGSGMRWVMNEILFHYEKIDPTTWAYLASLLIIGLFFKFGRFWSVRNLDLLLLILLAPGLLLVSEGQKTRGKRWRRWRRLGRRPASRRRPLPRASTWTAQPSRAGESPAAAGPSPPGDAAWTNRMRPRRRSPQRQEGRRTTPSEGTDNELSSAQDALRSGTTIERIGFIWLLATGLLLLGAVPDRLHHGATPVAGTEHDDRRPDLQLLFVVCLPDGQYRGQSTDGGRSAGSRQCRAI